MSAVLQVQDVWRVYDEAGVPVEALRGVDLEVAAGEFVALMGPSGSGKSTLLQLLGGLDQPTRGRVLVDDVDLSSLSRAALANIRNTKVGFVFQTFNLLGNLTVAENVALPAIIANRRATTAKQRTGDVLGLVGLADKAGRLPAQLSGGERQRVAIARALMMEPAVLLADEPTGNLDSAASDAVMAVLCACHERGQTVVMVTHDSTIAARAQRIVHLRDGRLVEETPLQRVDHPTRLADLVDVGDPAPERVYRNIG